MASKVVEDVIRMFRGGVSVSNIAEAMELPTVTVTALLLRGGVEDHELESVGEGGRIDELGTIRTGKVSDAVRQLVIDDWMKWLPMAAICDKYGLRRNMVWQILLEEGVPTRKKTAMRELVRLRRDVEIVDLYQSGMYVMDIAAAVGIGHGVVNYTLRKYNVPRRQAKRGPVRRSQDGFGELVHPRDVLRELTSE